MVFGWGKKKQVVEETREKPVLPTHKEATLENIPDILEDITNLRQKTLVIEVKSFQKRIEVDRKTLLSIVDELGKDSLNTNEMDPHLVLLVNRGKKEVISSIQNEFKGTFSEINSFDNVLGFQRNASRGIKKVGDMLGKHSRVIHIFAKKYAKKLKGDLGILTDNLSEVNELISNYNSNQELLESIRHSLSDFSNIKKDIEKQERRKMELEKSIEEEQQNEAKLQKDIEEMESSNNYKEFLDIKENITSVSVEEKSIKKKIEEQFLKISRPLNKYVYVSALDKPLKKITENLTLSPYDVLSAENMPDIKKILDAVRSGIESGSVSVKDVEKSKQSINNIQDLLPQLIAQKAEFIQKRDKLNESLTIFDNDRLVTLTHNLEKSRFNISDRESKISIIRQQIDSSKSSVHDMISKLELNLKQASSISYKISYSENDF